MNCKKCDKKLRVMKNTDNKTINGWLYCDNCDMVYQVKIQKMIKEQKITPERQRELKKKHSTLWEEQK